MFVARSLLALSLVASSLAAHQDPYALHRRGDPAGDSSSSSTTKNTTDTEPRRYIVEFHGTADSQVEATSLADRLNLTVVKVFNSDVFQGACVESAQDNLDMLKAQDPVAQAWHSKRIALAPMTVNQTYGEGAAGVNMSIHHMTGVDKLHAAGIRGKGVTVGIVDTGVLYTHPDLGGGFGPGFKVAGGYDLVGDSEWPDDPVRRPDNDPLDYLGHGTHVSGIIAGEGKMFTGVAPDATLRMYKVFSTIDSTSEDVLIEAFLMAYKDGSDIITSSIGSVSGWADNAWGLVASRLVEQGVVVTISAGNDGTAGAFAASSGSSGENVLAVASIDADILPGPSMNATFRVNGTTNTVKIPYRAATSWYPSNISNWPVVPLTLDTTVAADACSPLQNDTRDFTNQVVLVRRGGCNFEVKQKNLAAVNGTNALFYTNELPIVYPTTNYLGPGQLAMITREAGAEIIRAYKAGGNVTVDFTGNPVYSLTGVPNEETGGAPSYYTTLGATNELGIKPDIGAPGGYILSTYLKNGYGVLSGTSMACPYVAGVAALYIGKFGGRATHGTSFAKALAGRILSSGMAVPWNAGTGDVYDYGIPAPVAQVGTGLINATKVLDFATGLSFSKFALNDTRHFSRYHSVNITNTGATPITYTFSLQEYGGLNTFNTNASDWGTPRVAWSDELMIEPLRGVVPPVSFPRSPFTVQPGQTREAAIHFDPVSISGRTDTSAAQLPLYGGAIVVTGSNGETLSLPYQGLAANLETDVGTIFDYVIGFPTLTSTGAKTPIAKKANVTFNLDNSAHDYFTLYTRLRYASRELRWDIFDAAWSERDWVYPPVVGQHGYVGAATSFSGASPDAFFNSTSDDASDVITLPLVDQPRSIVGQYGVSLWWLGGLANGTQIAPGKYNMRIAALAPFGNPAHSDNWDVYKTPTIEVLPIQK